MNTKLNWLTINCDVWVLNFWFIYFKKGRTLKWPRQGRRQKPWQADTLQLQSHWGACSRWTHGCKKKKISWMDYVCSRTNTHTRPSRRSPLTHKYVHAHKHWALNALPSKDKGHLSCATVERVYVLEDRLSPQYGKNLLNQWMDKKP